MASGGRHDTLSVNVKRQKIMWLGVVLSPLSTPFAELPIRIGGIVERITRREHVHCQNVHCLKTGRVKIELLCANSCVLRKKNFVPADTAHQSGECVAVLVKECHCEVPAVSFSLVRLPAIVAFVSVLFSWLR